RASLDLSEKTLAAVPENLPALSQAVADEQALAELFIETGRVSQATAAAQRSVERTLRASSISQERDRRIVCLTRAYVALAATLQGAARHTDARAAAVQALNTFDSIQSEKLRESNAVILEKA